MLSNSQPNDNVCVEDYGVPRLKATGLLGKYYSANKSGPFIRLPGLGSCSKISVTAITVCTESDKVIIHSTIPIYRQMNFCVHLIT